MKSFQFYCDSWADKRFLCPIPMCVCVLQGERSRPTHSQQAILLHQLGVIHFHSIPTLPTWDSTGSGFSPPRSSTLLTTQLLGFDNLLQQLPELRKHFTY